MSGSVEIDVPAKYEAEVDIGPSDAELVDGARHDRMAFEPLYIRYADPIYRFCYRRLGDPDTAADATAQVFARALTALENFRGGSFRAWLFTIAYHVVVDDIRGRHPNLPLLAAEAMTDPSLRGSPERTALEAEDRATLRNALAQLPQDQQRIVELRLSGLNGVEIAEVLGRSHGAIKSSQFRAYARLRQILGGTEDKHVR
jgi:RNA polymerase sigma-70 factor (ECF subfamily)